MKACIWALAHLCTSSEGIELLLSDVVPQLIHLAENASVYSVRATAYYSLGLIGTTQAGADEVYKMGNFASIIYIKNSNSKQMFQVGLVLVITGMRSGLLLRKNH